jgi:phosphomevalonate kinase
VSEIKGTSFLLDRFDTGALDITIVGDNDFYSQRAEASIATLPLPSLALVQKFITTSQQIQLDARQLPRKLDSLAQLKPFLPTNATLSNVHKTGLGSSAALITSLVSALLLHFAILTPGDFSAQVTDGKRLAHHLAQYVHCLAQGKIGSGFDVSAAVFGSQIYTRFDPAVIEGIMKDGAVSDFSKFFSSRI